MLESNQIEVSDELETQKAELLAAIADPLRWKVLRLLDEGPRCVCDIQEHVPIAGNLLSYHLKVLRDLNLVHSQRQGRRIEYRLSEDASLRLIHALPVQSEKRA